MNIYRFVGQHSIIGDREFTDFGSRAEFSEEQFIELSKKAAFITDEEFVSLEIPQEDVLKYGSVHYYGARPQAFADKVEAAREKYRQMRSSLHD